MELRSDFYSTRLSQMSNEYISHVFANVLGKKDQNLRENILQCVTDCISRNDYSIPLPDEGVSDSDDSIDNLLMSHENIDESNDKRDDNVESDVESDVESNIESDIDSNECNGDTVEEHT